MQQEAEGQKQHIPLWGPASLVHCQAPGVAAEPSNKPVPAGTSWPCVPSYWTLLPVAAPQKQLRAPSDWRMLSGLTNKGSFNVSSPLRVRQEEMKVCRLGELTEEISHW